MNDSASTPPDDHRSSDSRLDARVAEGPLLAYHDRLVRAIDGRSAETTAAGADPEVIGPTSGASTPALARVTDGPLLAFHNDLVSAISRYVDPAADRTAVEPRHAGDRTVPANLGSEPNNVSRLDPRRAHHDTDAGHRGPRLARVLAAAAAIVVIAALGAMWVGHDTPTVAADVTVTTNGDRVTVVLDKTVSVTDLETALKNANVKVTVQPITTGPSKVNLFVGIIGDNTSFSGGDGKAVNRATFTPSSNVILQLGVLGTGDYYDSTTDAFARGEGLEGPSLTGTTYAESRAEIERRAARSGVTVTVRDPGHPNEPVADNAVIGMAQGTGPHTVIVGAQVPG